MAFHPEQFRDLYPFDSHFTRVGGHRYHFLDEGRNEPVVMIHGNPTWSFYYRNLVKCLRPTHRVLVPDHIGCGLSDKPSDRRYAYTLKQRVDDLSQFMDEQTRGQAVTLVVHDWGGMIGLAWAVRNPSKVKKLVILNTAGFRIPAGKKLPLSLAVIRNVPGFGALTVRGLNAFALGASRMAVQEPLPKRVREGLIAPYDSWQNRIATLRFVQDIPLSVSDPSYAIVKEVEENLDLFRDRPVWIGWGRKDFVFDDSFLEEWRHKLPRAEIQVYESAGHYVLEDAGEAILEAIRLFIQR